MKKWILIFFVIIIAFTGIFIKIYLSAVDPVKTAEKKAVSLAKEKVHISEVDNFHIYNGTESVDVIEGKNNKGQKIIVWIPEKTREITVKKASSGISKEEAIKKLLQEKNPKKIMDVRLGMRDNTPLWEIYYRSNNNLINYYYISFLTGELLFPSIENL